MIKLRGYEYKGIPTSTLALDSLQDQVQRPLVGLFKEIKDNEEGCMMPIVKLPRRFVDKRRLEDGDLITFSDRWKSLTVEIWPQIKHWMTKLGYCEAVTSARICRRSSESMLKIACKHPIVKLSRAGDISAYVRQKGFGQTGKEDDTSRVGVPHSRTAKNSISCDLRHFPSLDFDCSIPMRNTDLRRHIRRGLELDVTVDHLRVHQFITELC